jgi:hypothetical protein
MTRIIGAVLLVAVAVLGWWNQVLELRNAELGSALAIARRHEYAEDRACAELIDVARYGDYTATLQVATHMFARFGPRTSGARTEE